MDHYLQTVGACMTSGRQNFVCHYLVDHGNRTDPWHSACCALCTHQVFMSPVWCSETSSTAIAALHGLQCRSAGSWRPTGALPHHRREPAWPVALGAPMQCTDPPPGIPTRTHSTGIPLTAHASDACRGAPQGHKFIQRSTASAGLLIGPMPPMLGCGIAVEHTQRCTQDACACSPGALGRWQRRGGCPPRGGGAQAARAPGLA